MNANTGTSCNLDDLLVTIEFHYAVYHSNIDEWLYADDTKINGFVWSQWNDQTVYEKGTLKGISSYEMKLLITHLQEENFATDEEIVCGIVKVVQFVVTLNLQDEVLECHPNFLNAFICLDYALNLEDMEQEREQNSRNI